jgi:V/A-type H+-transporting ATPase subunit C
LPKKTTRDTDFLFLTAMLRARESRMLTAEKLDRLAQLPDFNEAAKAVSELGYPDMTGMSLSGLDKALGDYRAGLFRELEGHGAAVPLLDMFRLKYDYHNIKVLVKAAGANTSGDHLLSASGRVPPKVLSEAFITGEHRDLPRAMASAMTDAFGILSRTFDPQLGDLEVDRHYFDELSGLAADIGHPFVTGYVRLLIDSANLRTVVRSLRTKIGGDTLKAALIGGGSVNPGQLLTVSPDGEELQDVFSAGLLSEAARLGRSAVAGGPLTAFERACDDAVTAYLSQAKMHSFGVPPVVAYIAAAEGEITAIRMILTGKLSGIEPAVIRERLRSSYV